MSNQIKILCIDDEVAVLDGLKMVLEEEYSVYTEEDPKKALILFQEHHKDGEPFNVVICDMRMPGMDGSKFFSMAKRINADPTRILLTGYSEAEAAIAAVNEGNIFRFLLKPCPPEILIKAVADGIRMNELINAERQLLEQTLNGAVSALMEVLSLTQQLFFSRAKRIRATVKAIGQELAMEKPWETEMAAMFSQLGFFAIPKEFQEDAYHEKIASNLAGEIKRKARQTTLRLIQPIPRMEKVARLVDIVLGGADPSTLTKDEIIESNIIQIALDSDKLATEDHSPEEIASHLKAEEGKYAPSVLKAMATILGREDETGFEIRDFNVAELKEGMRLAENVSTETKVTLATKGTVVSETLLRFISNIIELQGEKQLPTTIKVKVQKKRTS